MDNSEVAPAWLQKLESRREKMRQGKLGHEAGAGSPCGECGDKCAGLDLHFWRKICRNCKCRKDQHICNDDDLSGWTMEILGQIASKPAFIKLNKQNVQLEWIPPNVSADVVSDYMEVLGASKIPVLGSDAAAKRKQQLEFQVPPHDLDASLCDNLTAAETQQMQQYIKKIRDHCVGQGHVVRMGDVKTALMNLRADANTQNSNGTGKQPPSITELLNIKDDDLYEGEQKPSDLAMENFLSVPTQRKLGGLRKEQIMSLVKYGPFFERIIADVKMRNAEDDEQQIVAKSANFLREYKENEPFRKEINDFLKLKSEPTAPLSPILKAPPNMPQSPRKTEPSLAYTDNPFEEKNIQENVYKCGLPGNVEYRADPVFHKIVSSPALTKALQETRPDVAKALILSTTPLPKANVAGPPGLPLNNMPLDLATLKSAVVNGPYYDKLFDTLQRKNISVDQCKLLQPIKSLRHEVHSNPKFCREMRAILSLTPINTNIYYGLMTNNNQTPQAGEVNHAIGSLTDQMRSLPLNDNNKGTCGATKSTPPAVACQDCKEPLRYGEVAVKAERAGREMSWHPQCFKCNMCRELLADLVYFFHGGEVFCGRDLAVKLKIPRCRACDELIFTKEFTAAENATFHIKHFCCFQCDIPLAGKQYIPDEKSNMPVCLKCYDTYYAASCQLCKLAIGPTDQGVSWSELHWHGACFLCAGRNCGKSLIGQRFCVKEQMPFCSPQCVHSIMN